MAFSVILARERSTVRLTLEKVCPVKDQTYFLDYFE